MSPTARPGMMADSFSSTSPHFARLSARRKPSSATIVTSPFATSSRHPVSTSRMSSTAMANSVFWIMSLSMSCGSEISFSPLICGRAG